MTDSRLTAGAIYRAVLLAFGLVVAGLIIQQLISLVLAVLIVIVIALPLSAFATALSSRGIPRAVGAVLGLLFGIVVLAAVIAGIVPVFDREINQFVTALPSIVDALRHRLGHLTGTSPSHVGQQIQHFVNGYTQHPDRLLGTLESIGASVAAVLGAIVVIVLTALYSAIAPQPLVDGFVRLFPPGRRPHARHVLSRLRESYLAWLRGLCVGMVVLGGITYLGLQLIGLPFAAFFAILTAIAMLVPYFGALASSIPPITLALTISPSKAILVAVLYVVAHQIEGNVIQPLVVARAVKMHPAAVAVGVIATGRLFGVVGLIVSVPILVTITILIDELWTQPMEQSRELVATGREKPLVTEVVPVTSVQTVREGHS
jgi:predicted PurR-regulated permease PerM